MIASFLVFYLVLSIEAIPQQHKAEILVDQGVNVQEINGQKFAGLLGGNGGVNGLYKNGKVSAASGSQGEHQIFKAAGPNGQIQSGSIKNGDRTGQFQSSNKDQLTVDAGNPSKITGNLHVANGKPQPFVIDRPNTDQSIITDTNGRKFVVSGLSGTNGVNIEGGAKPYSANFGTKSDGRGNIHSINTKLKENALLGVGPSYNTNIQGPNQNSVATIQLGVNPIDTGHSNPYNILPTVTLRIDKIRTLQCPEQNYGDFLGLKGFHIVEDSISIDVQPISVSGSSKTYGFPSCFNVKAKLQVPVNMDIENVGGQLTAYISPLGNLQCDRNYECSDRQTLNRPQGPCFFCNLCAKKSQNGKTSQILGNYIKDSSNICLAKSGKILPLEWQVCPPEGNIQSYNFFAKDVLGVFKQDVDATIRIFVKSKALKPAYCNSWVAAALNPICKYESTVNWSLATCRQAIISYSVSGQAAGIGSAFGRAS